MNDTIPSSMQAIFWSVGVGKLDLLKNKSYIIHQTLSFGSLEDIKWLKQQYSIDDIRDTFSSQPKSVYTKRGYNFAKNLLLQLTERSLNQDEYLATAPRQRP